MSVLMDESEVPSVPFDEEAKLNKGTTAYIVDAIAQIRTMVKLPRTSEEFFLEIDQCFT